MRRLLALLLALPMVGCVATAGPAREILIPHVAPLPTEAPGVEVHWAADGPVMVQPGACVEVPWWLRAHDVSRPARIGLDLQGSRALDGTLQANLTPGEARVQGDDVANGTAHICVPTNATGADGQLALLANAGDQTVAISSVRVIVSQ